MEYFTARVQSIEIVAAETVEVILRPAVPLVWRPGQFITIQIPTEDGRPLGRSYSVASHYSATDIVLLIKLVDGGVGSQYVAGLAVGDEISYTGPWGRFVAQEASHEVAALFVGTGTGVAPFVPMIDAILRQGRQTTVLAGFRHEEDVLLSAFHVDWEESSLFKKIIVVSRPEDGWSGEQGRVTDYLRAHPGLLRNAQIYICGNGSMVQEVREIAAEHGVPAEQIFFEKYNNL